MLCILMDVKQNVNYYLETTYRGTRTTGSRSRAITPLHSLQEASLYRY